MKTNKPVEYKIARFVLFAGDDYTNTGGWDNCVTSTDTLEHATELGLLAKGDWYHIVDLAAIGIDKVVARGYPNSKKDKE